MLFWKCNNLAQSHPSKLCKLGVLWNPQDLLLMMGTEIFKIDASWAKWRQVYVWFGQQRSLKLYNGHLCGQVHCEITQIFVGTLKHHQHYKTGDYARSR